MKWFGSSSCGTLLILALVTPVAVLPGAEVENTRFAENPIIDASASRTLGDKINGPSLIRVPAWVKNPLGKYYLYFAHHKGTFIRLAYADKLSAPSRTNSSKVALNALVHDSDVVVSALTVILEIDSASIATTPHLRPVIL
ncbi:MAG: hypothetical protein ACKVI3_08455 [Verrucomicrobiia bacterium]